VQLHVLSLRIIPVWTLSGVPIANPFNDESTTCKPRSSDYAVNSMGQPAPASARQAPSTKGQPKPNPCKPGRKPGSDNGTKAHRQPPSPEQIDEVYEAPLPHVCPDWGGPVDETHVTQQFQVEIPRKPIHRQFLDR
jgi:hypothetical protein